MGHQAYMDSVFYSEIHHSVITTRYIFQLVTSTQQLFGRNFFIWSCIITVSTTTMIYLYIELYLQIYGPIDPDHLQPRILWYLLLHNIKYKSMLNFFSLFLIAICWTLSYLSARQDSNFGPLAKPLNLFWRSALNLWATSHKRWFFLMMKVEFTCYLWAHEGLY